MTRAPAAHRRARRSLGAVLPALAAAGALACAGEGAAAPPSADELRRVVVEAPIRPVRGVLRGIEPWLFLDAERLLLANERAHGPRAGRRTLIEADAADPLPAILDFHRQLRARGVDLLFVPIPAKLAIYPDRLVAGLAAPAEPIDRATAGLVEALRREGIFVLDLAPIFLDERRRQPEPALYAATDTHWSPRGARVAARAVAGLVRERWPALAAGSASTGAVTTEPAPIEGDLRRLLPDAPAERESAPFFRAPEPQADARPLPILVLGDSHLRVYRGRRAGFADHLEHELGGSFETIAVEAGGATVSRQALARRIELLEGRRLVVWVSAARLFVSGLGWRPVELPPEKQRGGP